MTYASDNNHRDAAVVRRYNIHKPSDFQKYNRICGVCLPIHTFLTLRSQGNILLRQTPSFFMNRISLTNNPQQSLRQLAHKLAALPPEDPIRHKHENLLLSKLHDMAILPTTSKLSAVENSVTVSAFARRRLPVVLTRLRMAETVQAATNIIEQGHVRVGGEYGGFRHLGGWEQDSEEHSQV